MTTLDTAPASSGRGSRSQQIRRTIGQTLRLAWQAGPRAFILLILLSLLPAAIPPVVIQLSKKLIDLIAAAQSTPGPHDGALGLVIALGVLTAAQRVLSDFEGTRQELFGRRVYLEAERTFLRQAASVDLGHFDNSDWHDKVARAQKDMNFRPAQMTWALIGVTGNLVTLIGMLAILFTLHPVLVALVIASILPTAFIQQRINKKVYSFWWDETSEDRERSYLSELLSRPRDAKEIRSFDLYDHLGDRHRQLGEDNYQRMRRLYRTYDRYSVATGVISGSALGLAYAFVVHQGISGELSPGSLAAVIAAFAAITQQLNLITQSFISLDQHAAFLDDYFSFLAIEPLLPVAKEPVTLPAQLDEGVRFTDTHFRYPGGTYAALQGVDLHIGKGELVALVGDNGAGKSSMVKLLLRLYDPTAGSITLAGVDLRNVDPRELRSRIGVLFQDFATFELSVRENVQLGRPHIPLDDEAIWRALRAARADSVAQRLPAGLDSKVGRLFNGGHDLSGGEWQRLALARLLYRNADIWILDEPTAALDPEAEAAIFAELRANLGDRIGLIISHRFSTVRTADRIVVVNDGRITEIGSHEELLAHNGRYAELFYIQASGYR